MASISTESMIRIVSIGGGLDIDGGISTESAIRVAAAAAGSGGRSSVTFRNCSFSTESMLRIASAGRGCVIFAV